MKLETSWHTVFKFYWYSETPSLVVDIPTMSF